MFYISRDTSFAFKIELKQTKKLSKFNFVKVVWLAMRMKFSIHIQVLTSKQQQLLL